ncbi:MAG: ribosome maturation factor RimP [Pseudomonadota bacterium]|nr:ribosome maturation factor RimP [Pseudomonadota bacterium]
MGDVTEEDAEFADLVASEPVAARVVAVIAPTIADLGFDLVRVQYGGAPATLQVMVEPSDLSDLSVDACADISRAVSALLDVADPINGKYMLEVSSPGIDRPLTRPRDFSRFAGHEIKIELRQAIDGRKRFRGTLVGFEAGEVLLAIDVGTIGLAWPMVASARLVLTEALLAMAKAG